MVLNAKARIGGRHPTDTCTNPIFSGACSAAADLLGDKAAKSIETACDFIRRRQQKYTPICLLCGGNRLPPHRGGQRTPKLFLRRFRRKGDFGVRRNWEGSGSCVLMSVRDMDVLRLLCWCQNVRPDDLSSISTETERENLITLGLIKRHQRSDTLLLTNWGRAFL